MVMPVCADSIAALSRRLISSTSNRLMCAQAAFMTW